MADKKFGVKQIDLIGASGTPNLTSPNNLNLNAVTVAISTDVTIGGQVTSNIIVGTGKSIGIGTTVPTGDLDVRGQTNLSNLNVSGVSTFAGITTVTGPTLFSKQLNVSGVSTFNSTIFGNQLTVTGVSTLGTLRLNSLTNLLNLNTSFANASNVINFGNDLVIFNLNDVTFGNQNWILANEYPLYIGVKGETAGSNFYNSLITIDPGSDTNFPNTSNVKLGYGDGATKLETIGAGVTITGTTFTNQLSVSGVSTLGVVTSGNIYSSGVITATTFVGNFSGSITNATNLTGGYANASQLNVTGVTTISAGRIQADASSNLRFGNLAAGSGSSRNIAIGDQVLFSLSGGSGRNIGIGELSYYDTTSGQYNVGLGINAGQKITTGSYNVIIGGYDGQTGLDIRTSSNNVVIADGQGNIRQYIDSNGNVGFGTVITPNRVTVFGNTEIQQDSGSNHRIVLRSKPGSAYRWNIDNYGSNNDFRIFREDDATSANGFSALTIDNAGTVSATKFSGDGSLLTGIVAAGSGIQVKDNGSTVGTAATIDFGTNLDVTFGSGIATVSGASSVSAATTAYALAGTPNLNVGIVTATRLVSSGATLTSPFIVGLTTFTDIALFKDFGGTYSSLIRYDQIVAFKVGAGYWEDRYLSLSSNLNYILPNIGIGTTSTTSKLTVSGGVNVSGVVTASSFSGSGSGLTNLPAGQLTGTLPAIDGSALLNVNATGSGIVVLDDNANIGSAKTVNFGTGLDVTYSTSGIATISASGGSLQSRTVVTGITTAIENNGIGNTNITGFKSYALMRVGLSTAGWLRLYTDSASRSADASRSIGIDPSPGSGVIAEVITTGISTTQIISPFVMGGNLNNPADTTVYAAITNLSGVTSSISVNLTLLQLEA
jgi:hypothetical protein